MIRFMFCKGLVFLTPKTVCVARLITHKADKGPLWRMGGTGAVSEAGGQRASCCGSPRWEMMLAGCRKGHAVERRARIFCSSLSTKHAVPPLSPVVLTAVSTLQVFYQLWQKSGRHHLNSPCLRFLPGYPFISGGITKGKAKKSTNEEGLGLGCRKLKGMIPHRVVLLKLASTLL